MMENTLQYSSKPRRKFFYSQPKVSVQRAVLHGQAPYQHCDSSMKHNLQDQRFQKLLMSVYRHHPKSSLLFWQWKLKFRVHPKTVNLLWLWRAAQATPSKPLSPSPVSMLHLPRLHWGCPWIGPGRWFIWRPWFPSAGSTVQFCSCSAGVSQGWHRVEKNRQEKVASACTDLSTSTTCKTNA